MDGTPRLRSAFPGTPRHERLEKRDPPPRFGGKSHGSERVAQITPTIDTLKSSTSSSPTSDPVIPEHVLDAPSQRLFALSFWVLLQTWKVYDFVTLQESEEQSLWLFMKWLAIDGVFLYGLPSLRIPWLEWSPATMSLLFTFHSIADGMLMFRIPIPIEAGLAALSRSFWGAYELAISEHNVNPRSIMFNDSLILGRQIVHILPEGTAILNPDHQAFCVDDSRIEARLPIKINSTNPIAMDLLRLDLDNDKSEVIHISKSQIKAMHREASRLLTYSDKPNEPKTLYYPVKTPGLYLLQKVIDESNLEVARKHMAHTPVVPCPKAQILQSTPDRCRGELYNNDIEVAGTPPLTVKIRKMVNKVAQNASFENIMPEDFFSPLTKQDYGTVVLPQSIDTAWARTRHVRVPLTESLSTAGKWVCSIQEVRDGFGNIVRYGHKDHESQDKHLPRSSHLHQTITVHERPTISFDRCSPQIPKRVAKGSSTEIPFRYGSTGHGSLKDVYNIDLAFSPEGEDYDSTKAIASQQRFSMKSSKPSSVREPGLYTITGVSTEFCTGEVLEPASCLIQNPPQPQLSINEEQIFDKCAGSPIGLRVDLDLIGTPPFEIIYRTHKKGERQHYDDKIEVEGLRDNIVIAPRQPGHYEYEFVQIKDAIYPWSNLRLPSLQQDVKPSADARFSSRKELVPKTSCMEDSVSFDVDLSGEGPFNLEYELIHGGKRSKHSKQNIEDGHITIETGPLREGGEYTLLLKSVVDGMGCKEFPKDEAMKFNVRHQKPKVGFGHIEGRRIIHTLEGSKAELPLRLSGVSPWTIKYADPTGKERTKKVQDENGRIEAAVAGIYKLLDLHDAQCPGTVDETAEIFQITRIPRPELRIATDESTERIGNTLMRDAICEGQDDSVEVLFKGKAPYEAYYEQRVKPAHGAVILKNKQLRSAVNVGSLPMDTSQAGQYEYKFTELGDTNYRNNEQHFTPLVVKQRVNARPSVAFTNPGKTYSYCSVESDGEEVIPITLSGEPPFDLEIEIRHYSTARSETVTLNNIQSRKHNIRIPHHRLQTGQSSVLLRRVSDSNGCARSLDSTSPRVQISVHDPPTITPLETSTDFCVGDRLNFALTGAAPFSIFYTFEGAARKAVAGTSTFRRLAEKPGTFAITGLQDSASSCRANVNLTSHIHGLPSARISQGRESYADIHEGGNVEILFEFGGTPPFEFTYTRSSNTARGASRPGVILDMKSEISDSHAIRVVAHEEGTYEVVAIKDRYCAYAKPGVKMDLKEAQKRLAY